MAADSAGWEIRLPDTDVEDYAYDFRVSIDPPDQYINFFGDRCYVTADAGRPRATGCHPLSPARPSRSTACSRG